jgi:hypothetical protein
MFVRNVVVQPEPTHGVITHVPFTHCWPAGHGVAQRVVQTFGLPGRHRLKTISSPVATQRSVSGQSQSDAQ